MEKYRELARKVSNWGRWGADDERGTINFITPDVVRRAAACVRRGDVFSLGLPFGAERPADRPGRTRQPDPPDERDRRPARRRPRRAPLRRRLRHHAAPVRDAVGQPGARLLRREALQRLPGGDASPPPARRATPSTRSAAGDRLARRAPRRGARARRRAPRAGHAITPADLEAAEQRAGRARRARRRPPPPHRPPRRLHARRRPRRRTCGRCPASGSRASSGCTRARSRRWRATRTPSR